MKKISLLIIGIALIMQSTLAVYAASSPSDVDPTAPTQPIEDDRNIICGTGGVYLPGCQKIGNDPVNAITNKLLPGYLVGFIAFIAVAGVVTTMWAGYLFLTSLGNDEKKKKAIKIMYYSILGLVLSMLSYIIVQIALNLQFGA